MAPKTSTPSININKGNFIRRGFSKKLDKLYDIAEMKGRPLNTSMVCNRLKQETQSTFISLKDALGKIASNYKN